MLYLLKLCINLCEIISRIVVRIIVNCEFILFSMMIVSIKVDLVKVKDFGLMKFWCVVNSVLVKLVNVVLMVKVVSLMCVGFRFSE